MKNRPLSGMPWASKITVSIQHKICRKYNSRICLRYPPVFCTIPRNYIFQFEIVSKVFLLNITNRRPSTCGFRALNYIEFKKLNPEKFLLWCASSIKIIWKTSSARQIMNTSKIVCSVMRNTLYYFIIRFMAATERVSARFQFEAGRYFTGYKDIYSKGK